MQVRAEGLERMNLLGLFMLAALQERVEALERSGARDEVAIESGGMVVTLSFSPHEAVVHSGVHGRPRARLIGPLDALVDFAQGRFVTPWPDAASVSQAIRSRCCRWPECSAAASCPR